MVVYSFYIFDRHGKYIDPAQDKLTRSQRNAFTRSYGESRSQARPLNLLGLCLNPQLQVYLLKAGRP